MEMNKPVNCTVLEFLHIKAVVLTSRAARNGAM